ncbi:NIL domain-containing protein, partial [Enterococcus sp. S181_ASV_20]|nr:NIL domain-containing protein [Enterococcus sp. S181_ASV_20]
SRGLGDVYKRQANEPVVSQVIRNFPVNISIVYGNIERATGNSFGTLTVQLTGDADKVEEAIAFITVSYTHL